MIIIAYDRAKIGNWVFKVSPLKKVSMGQKNQENC